MIIRGLSLTGGFTASAPAPIGKVTFVRSQERFTPSTTVTVNPGEVALCVISQDGSTPSIPTGWTPIANNHVGVGSTFLSQRILVYANTTGSVQTRLVGGAARSAVAVVYSGVNTVSPYATPVNGASIKSTTSGFSVAGNSGTLDVTNGTSMVVGLVTFSNGLDNLSGLNNAFTFRERDNASNAGSLVSDRQPDSGTTLVSGTQFGLSGARAILQMVELLAA